MEDGTDISERYDKLLSCWPSSIEQIRILILGREHPVKLPLPFLQGTRRDSLLRDGTPRGSEVMPPEDETSAGEMLFVPTNLKPVMIQPLPNSTWRLRPENAQKGHVEEQDQGDGRSSIPESQWSKASDTRRVSGEKKIETRDQVCLITRVHPEGDNTLEGAHIVPKARLDVYQELVDPELELAFHPSFRLALEHYVHKAYDTYKWTLYPKNGNLHILVWTTNLPKSANITAK
ncbi:MAG: hypothetical protein CYPHOPRED_002366 [Cyphobasidiales sp. Tagirdzhanova-0007]|nr:MAG: hypothetical protein CYPHOPRED_002366 [Cyphobasidiales sp. Tagirdzhanova-0007]